MTNKLAMGRKKAKTKQVKHCKDCHDLSREVLQRVFSKGVCNLKKRKNSVCVCVLQGLFSTSTNENKVGGLLLCLHFSHFTYWAKQPQREIN